MEALDLGSAILFVLGSIIGSGIFLTTGVMAAALPSPTLLLCAWAAGGAALLIFFSGGIAAVAVGFADYLSHFAPALSTSRVIYIGAAGLFVVNTLVERPVESFAGLGFLALGLPVYWYSKT